MITLLGALLGFIGSVAPELIKLLQDRRDKAHELKMLKAQAENAQALREYDAKLLAMQADAAFYTAEQDRLSSQIKNDATGIWWVDASNAMVRPIVAYGFFALYAFIKVYTMTSMGIETVITTPQVVWGDEDAGIFSAIVAYYFGSRHMKRTMGRG